MDTAAAVSKTDTNIFESAFDASVWELPLGMITLRNFLDIFRRGQKRRDESWNSVLGLQTILEVKPDELFCFKMAVNNFKIVAVG